MGTSLNNAHIGRERRLVITLLCIVLSANIVSYFYLSSRASHNPHVPPYPIVAGDSELYTHLADNILTHRVFSDSPDLNPSRDWPPGYPVLLAGVKAITGTFTPIVIFQITLTLFALVLVYRIGRRFLSPTLAFLPALFYGLDPMVIFSNTAIVTDSIFSALLVCIIYLLFFQSRVRGVVLWGLAGIAIGIATMIRPIAEFLIIILPIAYIYREWRAGEKWRFSSFAYPAIVYLIGVILTVAPWVLRNHSQFGPYEIAHVGASDLLEYDARDFLAWKEMNTTARTSVFFPARHLAAPEFAIVEKEIQDALAKATPPGDDENNYAEKVAMQFILADPFRYAYFHLVNTAPFFLAGGLSSYQHIVHQERDNTDFSASTFNSLTTALRDIRNRDFSIETFWGLFPAVPEAAILFLVAALALCALILKWRRFEILLMCGLVAYFAILTGPLSIARYRIPAEPFLFILAAYGAHGIVGRMQKRFMTQKAADAPGPASQPSLLKKVLRYLVSGITGMSINLGVYSILVFKLGVWYISASVIAFCAALLVSFSLQKFYAFRDNTPPKHGQQFAAYVLFMLFNLCANTLLLYLFVEHTQTGRFLGVIFSNAIIAVWSFFVYDRLIFREEPIPIVWEKADVSLSKVSVVIPCYNEAGGIKRVIESVPKGVFEIIVVDNNSTDNSAQVAREAGARVVREEKQGYGAALKCGFREARGEFICSFDADNQYPSELLPQILDFLARENLDFISASRFPLTDYAAMDLLHRIGNWGLTLIANILFGLSLADSQSGMWFFKRVILKSVLSESDDMPFSQELKIRAARDTRIRFAEYHIPYHPRIGESKLFPFRHGIKVLFSLFTLRFKI